MLCVTESDTASAFTSLPVFSSAKGIAVFGVDESGYEAIELRVGGFVCLRKGERRLEGYRYLEISEVKFLLLFGHLVELVTLLLAFVLLVKEILVVLLLLQFLVLVGSEEVLVVCLLLKD